MPHPPEFATNFCDPGGESGNGSFWRHTQCAQAPGDGEGAAVRARGETVLLPPCLLGLHLTAEALAPLRSSPTKQFSEKRMAPECLDALHPQLTVMAESMQMKQIKADDTGCPLCGSAAVDSFFADQKRIYRRCRLCALVFVPKRFWLSEEEERATYDLHDNDAEDPGYGQFLSRLSGPLLEKLDAEQTGLDFGCGPDSPLSAQLERQGHRMDRYDPLYRNDPSLLDNRYDFICATEVVEHLRDPGNDIAALFAMLNRGGWLGIMTKLVIDQEVFRRWHYIRDLTHLCFYSQSTFAYLAQRFNATVDFIGNDVVLLQKM